MVAFMDTTATIPTGAMAERWKWGSFVIWGLFCGAIYYPLFAAWTWGGGWLAKTWDTMSLGAGYVDFAGSGVVHAVGGVAALAGAMVLGPRIGKFDADGKPRALPGHHIPMAMLGTFILLFGWFGFNAASTFAATDVQFATVATNTAIAGAFGAIVGDAVDHQADRQARPRHDGQRHARRPRGDHRAVRLRHARPIAALIGAIAGVLVIEAVFFVERKLKIDDPVGAIAVHGVSGTFGVLAVGLFANGSYGAGWNGIRTSRASRASSGATAASSAPSCSVSLVIWTVIFGIAFAFFKIQDIDLEDDGQGRHPLQGGGRDRRPRPARDGRPGLSRVRQQPATRADVTEDRHMKLITAIIKPFKLDDVKDALKAAGVTGITVERGPRLRPPGRPHRDLPGHRVPDRLRPQGRDRDRRRRRDRRRASSTPSSRAASTGKIGDGKIWVTDVDRLVRIRTGRGRQPTPSRTTRQAGVRGST